MGGVDGVDVNNGDLRHTMKRAIREYAHKTRLAIVLAAVLGAGAQFAFQSVRATDEKANRPSIQLHVDRAPVNREAKTTTSFAPVVKKVSPSVVRVDITGKAKDMEIGESPFDNPMLRRFFGDQLPQQGRRGGRMQRAPREHGLGSGVIVTQDGYILTNNHVVENADKVHVTLDDGREFDAKVVGTDPKTDIAVVKVEATGLPYMQLADSDKIEVGDVTLAIGNPFGVGQTVTSGIISATGRAAGIGGPDFYEDFIQTDAAINPGNSGGALIDAEGRLIGINTAILSRTGGNNGIGFAVPVNLAKNVMEQLITNGKVVRGFLGVNIQTMTPALAKQFDLKDTKGALISEVTPNSPAEKAGLKSGDVIMEFNGKPVKDSRHLKLAVGATAPGTKAPVKVLREGKSKELTVTLKELPSDQMAGNDNKSAADTDALDGVTVGDVDSNVRQQFNLPRDLKGAVVTDVDPDSASYAAGLRPGDVVLEIDRKPVNNAEEAVKLSENIKNKSSILLRVWSKGGSHYLVVDESKVG
jgi:serine protease Do